MGGCEPRIEVIVKMQKKKTILSPVTDSLLFLNQLKRENIFPRKNVPVARIDCGTTVCKMDTLPRPLGSWGLMSLIKAYPTGYIWSKYECFLISGCQDTLYVGRDFEGERLMGD